MRLIGFVAVLPVLAACGTQEPLDCTPSEFAPIERCIDENRAKGEAAALVACLPFSQPLKTQGIWVVGFEKNDFFEGSRRPSEEALWTHSTGAELIVDETVFQPTNETRAFEVEVRGRRALCPVGVVNPYPIAVEKIRIRRRIT